MKKWEKEFEKKKARSETFVLVSESLFSSHPCLLCCIACHALPNCRLLQREQTRRHLVVVRCCCVRHTAEPARTAQPDKTKAPSSSPSSSSFTSLGSFLFWKVTTDKWRYLPPPFSTWVESHIKALRGKDMASTLSYIIR